MCRLNALNVTEGSMKRAFHTAAAAVLSVVCSAMAVCEAAMAESATSGDLERVMVEANNVLPGIWRFPPHERRALLWSNGAFFKMMGPEMYCRLGLAEPGFSFNCFETTERESRAALDAGGLVVLSWKVVWGNTSGCRWTFRGHLQSKTEIFGHLGVVCDGRLHENWAPMTITKPVLSDNIADTGGQSAFLRRLLEEMADGHVTEAYTKPHYVLSSPAVVPLPVDVEKQLFAFLTPDDLRPLGKIVSVVYVNQYFPIIGWSPDGGSPVYSDNPSSIYTVEFENGERLCSLHRRPDGVLDQFECI
jgi:hypothetical protein